MPPRMLVVVSPVHRRPIPIRHPEEWRGQFCYHCHKHIERDVAVFLVNRRDDESPVLTCLTCVGGWTRPDQPDLCLWCGNPGQGQDTGDIFCQRCWSVYVAYVSDMTEGDTPEQRLYHQVHIIVAEENARAAEESETTAPAD